MLPPGPGGRPAGARPWPPDRVSFRTVGIDIGSATSHLVFSLVEMHREASGLSSRFRVARRETCWRSPVAFTPYAPDGAIDAAALGEFVGGCYRSAGLARDDVDSGAVILTGEALKRRNARAIADLFAGQGGRFVCAAAGHHLEAALAAHGSGAVALASQTGQCVLHLDIGGGTCKLALITGGEVTQTAAIAVGGRLLTLAGGVAERADEPALTAASHLGLPLAAGAPVTEAAVGELAGALAGAVAEFARGEVRSPLARALLVTEPPVLPGPPDVITMSGGVAEYVFGHCDSDFADLAPALALALRERLGDGPPLREAGQRIRATVIGAAQFSVQVSGSTVDAADQDLLPLTGLPVLYPGVTLAGDFTAAEVADGIAAAARRMDIGPGAAAALGFDWRGDPSYRRLRALADGVVTGRERAGLAGQPLILLVTGDVAGSLGRMLRRELAVGVPVVALDGLELAEFDYVDIGEMVRPAGVVPVVIRSLLFAGG